MARSDRIARLGIFVLTALISVFIAEWSVRLALPDYDPAGQMKFAYHPRAGTVLGQPATEARQIKNSGDYNVAVRFNKNGFRDKQDVAGGRDRDIYVTGDSFAFGWGVEEEERFSSVLGTLTGRRVYNVSASSDLDGYARALNYAENLGARIRHVIVALNMIDDVKNYALQAQQTNREELAASRSQTDQVPLTFQNLKTMLLRDSALYFLLTSSIGSVEWLRTALVRIGLIKSIKVINGGPPADSAIFATADRLARLARRYDLTVLIIPSRGLWVGKSRDAASSFHNKMRTALHRVGVKYVDLRRRMEGSGTPMRYHFPNDGHWVAKGHALAARALAEYFPALPTK